MIRLNILIVAAITRGRACRARARGANLLYYTDATTSTSTKTDTYNYT